MGADAGGRRRLDHNRLGLGFFDRFDRRLRLGRRLDYERLDRLGCGFRHRRNNGLWSREADLLDRCRPAEGVELARDGRDRRPAAGDDAVGDPGGIARRARPARQPFTHGAAFAELRFLYLRHEHAHARARARVGGNERRNRLARRVEVARRQRRARQHVHLAVIVAGAGDAAREQPRIGAVGVVAGQVELVHEGRLARTGRAAQHHGPARPSGQRGHEQRVRVSVRTDLESLAPSRLFHRK